MKPGIHLKYLRFILLFIFILWGVIGIFDFVNILFPFSQPLEINQRNATLELKRERTFTESKGRSSDFGFGRFCYLW
jgi:hypothetical protein